MKTKKFQTAKGLLAKLMALVILIGTIMLVGGTSAVAADVEKTEISAEDLAAHLEFVNKVATDLGDEYTLISDVTTLDDDGMLATTRIYKKPIYSIQATNSSSSHVYAERIFTESKAKFKWVKINAEGDFTWDGETAYVYRARGDAVPATNPSSVRVTSNPPAVGHPDCGSNFLFGNKYAYIEKKATATNDITTIDYTFELVVNRNGDAHTNPSGGTIIFG